jgi:hypothetical protein
MKSAVFIARTLGKAFKFPHQNAKELVGYKQQIIQGLQDHGCICIKDVNFNEKEQTIFTKTLWD